MGHRLGLVDSAGIALTAPLGLSALIFAAECVDRFGGHGWVLPGAALAVGLLGLLDLAGTRSGRRFALGHLRDALLPVLSAAGGFALLCLPWLHVPTRGILGYSQVNDQVVHGLVAEWIAAGRPSVSGVGWDFALAQPRAGYPVGSHELLAIMLAPLPDIQRAYSPTLALLVAFAACPAYWLVRRSGSSETAAVLGGALAAGSFLQSGYAAQGYLPSMTATVLILSAIALLVETARRPSFRLGFAAGIAIGASVAVYSFSVGVFIVAPALLGLIRTFRASPALRALSFSHRSATMQAIAGISGGIFLLVAPVAAASWRYFSSVYRPTGGGVGQVGGATDLGNLLHPLHYEVAFGSWIAADYRLDYERAGRTILGASVAAGMTRLGIAAAVLLIVTAGVQTARKGYWDLWVAFSGPLFAVLYVRATQGPYYVAKTYQVASVYLIASIFVGAEAIAGLHPGRSSSRLPLRPARAGLALSILAVWIASSLWSDLKEARSASIPPPIIRTDLPHAAAAVARRGGSFLVLADTSIWSYLPVPGASPASVRTSLAPGAVPDSDSISSAQTNPTSIITPALGGLSIPPPPYRPEGDFGTVRLYSVVGGEAPTRYPIAAERGGEIGSARLNPGDSRVFATGRSRHVLLGVLDPDSRYVPFVQFQPLGDTWHSWEADRNIVVPSGGGSGSLRFSLPIQEGGKFRVALVGLFFGARLTVDGTTFALSGGQIHSPLIGPEISLRSGVHTVSLRSPVPGQTSYAQAFSLERVGGPGPTSYLCVGGQRYTASAGRPAQVPVPGPSIRVENCGQAVEALDWVDPI